MIVRTVANLVAGLLLLAVTTVARAVPLDAYGKLPTIEDAAISPSGHAVALMVTDGEQRLIVVQDLASGQVIFRAPTDAVKMRSIEWAGDEHLLIVTTATASPMYYRNARQEWAFAFTLDVKTRKLTPLMRDTEYSMNTVFGNPEVRVQSGAPVILAQGALSGRLVLYRISLDGKPSKLVEEGSNDTGEWVVGVDGQAIAQETYEAKSGRWALKLRDGPGWRTAASAVALTDRPYVMGLGRDAGSVLYAMADSERRWTWREARLDGRPGSEPIAISGDQWPLRSPRDGLMIGYVRLVGDEQRRTYFDPEDTKAWSFVTRAFPGQAVRLISSSADRRRLVVLVDSPTDGPAYAWVDVAARKASWLGAVRPGIEPGDIAEQRVIRFKAADGLELSGYLTIPRSRTAKALPLIVFPHGGPAARDTAGFDWWAQGMASRGYAVLQTNFRGSAGLGDSLLEAGYGQWGRKMQTDLSDGVRYLAAEGTIDPQRVCIVGASYGGYAAMAGAALDTGVYRCAVAVSGLSDLRRFVAWSKDQRGVAAQRYWTRFMGADDPGDPKLLEVSPISHIDRVSIPVLLIHGKDDTVVPIEQSRILAEALKKAGKSVELLEMKGEDHWLSRGETRLQTLTATMAFVEKHNPPN